MRKYLVWFPIVGIAYYDTTPDYVGKYDDGLNNIALIITHGLYQIAALIILVLTIV